RTLEARRWILAQELPQPLLEPGRNVDARRERRRRQVELRVEDGGHLRLREWRLAGDESPGDAAERVEIRRRTLLARRLEDLLRRHVGRRAREDRHARVRSVPGDPEVGQ